MRIFDTIFSKRKAYNNVTVADVNKAVDIIQKEAYRKKKNYVDTWIDNYIANYTKEEIERRELENKKIGDRNNICPKCGHTIVVDKVIKAKNDVQKYCHCNGCGHEWEKEELYDINFDPYEHLLIIPHFLDSVVLSLWTSGYDPYDVSCDYDSDEEWELDTIKKFREKYSHIIEKYPLEVLFYFGHTYGNRTYLEEEIFGVDAHYSFYENKHNAYLGKFSPKMEQILTEKIGVKNIEWFNRWEQTRLKL